MNFSQLLLYDSRFTDSKIMYHAVKLSKQIVDKRLNIDLVTIKENKAIENIIQISKEKQIADSLTKKGAIGEKLIQAISSQK